MVVKKDRYRILIAKLGFNGHDRGAKVVARALRDAGFEVIYTGLHQTPEQVVETAIQEDVDVLGLSILSGAHLYLFTNIMQILKKEEKNILVIAGGVIPDDDIPKLKAIGVSEIFGPGTDTRDIINFIKTKLKIE